MSSEKEHDLLRKMQGAPEPILPTTFAQKVLHGWKNFCQKQLSPGSTVTRFAEKWYEDSLNEASMRHEFPDYRKDPQAFVFVILMSVLTLTLVFSMVVMPGLIDEIHQLHNDLNEQQKIIEVESKNKAFLDALEADNNALQMKMDKVAYAVPKADERAESVISNLEQMAQLNGVGIDAISINELSDSQFYYDEMIGVVQPYEYTFSIKSNLYGVLAFLQSLRDSLRIMDVMAFSVDQNKETGYQANFSILTYHLISDN